MPLSEDHEYANMILNLVSSNREISEKLTKLIDDPSETYALDGVSLTAISSVLTVNADVISKIFEENQTIIERVQKIEQKLDNRLE